MPKRFHLTRLTRGFRAVRGEARDLLRGGAPTAELLRPVGPDVPPDAWVLQVLDLCMGVGEVLFVQWRACGGDLGDDDAVGRGLWPGHG